jgi:hypothetical protein
MSAADLWSPEAAAQAAGGALAKSTAELAALRTARTVDRQTQCRQLYGTLQPDKQLVLRVLRSQQTRYGHRLPDLGQKGRDDVLVRALVRQNDRESRTMPRLIVGEQWQQC